MSRSIGKIRQWWAAEARRRFLWLPVGFGAGIAAYFSLAVEPQRYLLPSLWLASCVLLVLLRKRFFAAGMLLMLMAAGAAWAQFYTGQMPQQVIHQALEPRPVMGTVTDIVRTEHGVRLTLEQVTISDFPAEQTPMRVRISVRLRADSQLALPHIGDVIHIRASMRPPMGPVLPHGFDFARYFYFRGIGGVGYGLPPWRVVVPDAAPGLVSDFRNWRVEITEEILTRLPQTGGIAAGLITGDARAISAEDFERLRASNLYHIIAISGEHMVVIAGVIFISLRMLALLLPRRVAFRPEIKTGAAVVTLVLVTAYLFVTGLPISAVRAYVMIFLVLLAVILRRHVDPMRSLSITALVMLAADPATLIDPGFQLSFAATLAIIALVETALLRPYEMMQESKFRKALRLFFAMICISIVAEAATAPLVIAQFNNLSPYGVLANMLATPLMSFFLMPTVALYFILLPLGLHPLALWLMDWGIRGLLGIAYWVSGFPHAQLFIPAIPDYGIALFILGLAWLCLWQRRARLYGLVPMVAGVAALAFVSPPDILVGGAARQIAVRSEEGHALARGRVTSMIPNLWANGLGYAELPEADVPAWRCDTLGCVASVHGMRIAFPRDAAALAEDCQATQLVMTSLAEASCPTAQVIGQKALEANNVMAFWIDGTQIRMETSADWQGKRPWSAHVVEDADDAD